MFITVEELEKYTGVMYGNDEGKIAMQQSFCQSSCDIVEQYLGYEPTLKQYTHSFDGPGTNNLFLKAKPIIDIMQVVIDNKAFYENYTYHDECIYRKNGIFPEGMKNIRVTYLAGWKRRREIQSPEDDIIDGGSDTDKRYDDDYDGGDAYETARFLPEVIKLTALRIATLLQTEGDNNIGVTSKSFGDSGARTFVSYTNYDRYLLPISKYKLLVI
jgi:hypothetical protein